MPKGDKLTAKQRAFVDACIAGKSPSDAYRTAYNSAGMSAASVSREAATLLSHPKITPILEALDEERRRAADAATQKAISAAGLDREWIIGRYMAIADLDMRRLAQWKKDGTVEFTDSDKISDADAVGVQEISHEISPKGAHSVRMKTASKQAALDSLSKIMGLFDKDSGPQGDEGKLNLTINIG